MICDRCGRPSLPDEVTPWREHEGRLYCPACFRAVGYARLWLFWLFAALVFGAVLCLLAAGVAWAT
jgi:hypothetical protein